MTRAETAANREKNMIYHDPLGKAWNRKYVVVVDMDDGDLITDGIYEDHQTALGYAMEHIFEMQESYDADGDMFEIQKPDYRDNGEYIKIRFQKPTWNKPCEEIYMILYCEERAEEFDKPKN